MKSSAKKVELASVDDLFSTEESRADAQREKVVEIPLSELHPFKGHPFKVKDDEAMMETADSIKQYGVLVPAIARPDPEGGYERARESGTEQNYDMIDGCVNNVPKKPRRIGGRWSVLDRLHIKQAQRKQKDQTQQQQQERSRKN